MSETTVPRGETTTAIGAPASAEPSGRQIPIWLSSAAIVVCAVAIFAGANGLSESLSMAVRVVLVVAGLFGLMKAADALVRRFFPRIPDTGFVLAVAWLAIVIGTAALADILPLGEARDVSKTLAEPSLIRPDLFSKHPLGTDRQGLDILAELIYGARVSLIVGICAVLVGTIVGGAIGLLAGYYRGPTDRVVSVVSDSMLAFPPLVLLLAMVAVLQPNVRNVTIGLAVLVVPTYIRLVRANTIRFAQREFVIASKAMGASGPRIVVREILPNVLLPVLSYGFLIVAVLIVAEASLSFLGLSIQRPNPTWGNLIAAGQNDFDRNPHLVFAPGVVLFSTVFALNRVGDHLRRWWEPSDR